MNLPCRIAEDTNIRETRALEIVVVDPHTSSRVRKKMVNKLFQYIEILFDAGRGENEDGQRLKSIPPTRSVISDLFGGVRGSNETWCSCYLLLRWAVANGPRSPELLVASPYENDTVYNRGVPGYSQNISCKMAGSSFVRNSSAHRKIY